MSSPIGAVTLMDDRVAAPTSTAARSLRRVMHDDAGAAMASAALYDRYFAVVPATTPGLLDAAHALRYQVYCVEHPFLDPAQQAGEREVDHYDAHSVHAALIYRPTGTVVGCVRLILPQAGDGLSSLPIHSLIDDKGRARLNRCHPATTAEISRYAVSKIFRQRADEYLYPDVHFGEIAAHDVRRLAPHVSLGLVRGVAQLAAERRTTTVCASLAPALRRLLRRWGLMFESLGPLIDYHGLRQPVLANCETLVRGMAAQQVAYYQLIDAEYHGTPSRPYTQRPRGRVPVVIARRTPPPRLDRGARRSTPG